ncbi:MAG: MBL fold metallo-hydrolase [Firmicutes bacterium]|nr:MBL fold metallo-hydrolase [Bacillota bacterium]
MIKKILDQPEIFQLRIPLPNNPLRNLNCYVMKTESGNLVVDTGFNQTECFEALSQGLEMLSIDMDRTTLFLTHLHSDHIGLVEKIRSSKTRVIMGETDYRYFEKILDGKTWQEYDKRFLQEGFPEEDLIAQAKINPAIIYAPKKTFEATLLKDTDVFFIGNLEFECVHTPGHTPGHTCLYLRNEKIMFLGDHVLFDITPNITAWPDIEDSLGDYLKSLDRIGDYDIKVQLPAHRKVEISVYERIDQLKQHHVERLAEIIDIIKNKDDQNAYVIASQLKWSMRGKDWSEFPIQQKWFAVGETMSHLDYLRKKGLIYQIEKNQSISYQITTALTEKKDDNK